MWQDSSYIGGRMFQVFKNFKLERNRVFSTLLKQPDCRNLDHTEFVEPFRGQYLNVQER
jgi:hypothetical protein